VPPAALRESIVNGMPSPIRYNSPKPKEILDEDKVIQAYKINVKPADVVVRPVGQIFQ
jgi:zinc protease